MHDHDEKCLKYMSNCHMGPTQSTKNKMGLSPINKLKKNCKKKKVFPTPIENKANPKFYGF